VQAHPLSKKSLDPISNDCVTHFLGDRQAEAPSKLGLGSLTRNAQDVSAVQLPTAALDRHVVGTLSQAHLFRDAAAHFFAMVIEIRLRPLARRRRSTSRPPRVFLRARKPWVRLRLLLWGWYVRFTVNLQVERRGIDTRDLVGSQATSGTPRDAEVMIEPR
jgi:hypothetical protein